MPTARAPPRRETWHQITHGLDQGLEEPYGAACPSGRCQRRRARRQAPDRGRGGRGSRARAIPDYPTAALPVAAAELVGQPHRPGHPGGPARWLGDRRGGRGHRGAVPGWRSSPPGASGRSCGWPTSPRAGRARSPAQRVAFAPLRDHDADTGPDEPTVRFGDTTLEALARALDVAPGQRRHRPGRAGAAAARPRRVQGRRQRRPRPPAVAVVGRSVVDPARRRRHQGPRAGPAHRRGPRWSSAAACSPPCTTCSAATPTACARAGCHTARRRRREARHGWPVLRATTAWRRGAGPAARLRATRARSGGCHRPAGRRGGRHGVAWRPRPGAGSSRPAWPPRWPGRHAHLARSRWCSPRPTRRARPRASGRHRRARRRDRAVHPGLLVGAARAGGPGASRRDQVLNRAVAKLAAWLDEERPDRRRASARSSAPASLGCGRPATSRRCWPRLTRPPTRARRPKPTTRGGLPTYIVAAPRRVEHSSLSAPADSEMCLADACGRAKSHGVGTTDTAGADSGSADTAEEPS